MTATPAHDLAEARSNHQRTRRFIALVVRNVAGFSLLAAGLSTDGAVWVSAVLLALAAGVLAGAYLTHHWRRGASR